MANGLSIATIQDRNRTPYTLYAGFNDENAKRIYNLTKIIDAGMTFPVSEGKLYPAFCKNCSCETIDIAEYNSADDKYYVVDRLQVASDKFNGNPKGYPLVCRAEYINTNILKVRICDGKSNTVLVKKKIFIRRQGQDTQELERNNVIPCTGMSINENNSNYVPYAVGFVRYRSNNTKKGKGYEKLDFVPCKPYFEQIIRKPAQFGACFEDFTHVDKCEDGTPVIELAEYSEADYVMKTMCKIRLNHIKYTEMGALSARGNMCVKVFACYLDGNTMFVTIREKAGLKKYDTEYVLDINRTIKKDTAVPVVPAIPVDKTDREAKDNKEEKETLLDRVEDRFRPRTMDDSLMAINSLIGLDSVKRRIQTMSSHIIYEQMRAKKLGIPFEAECPRLLFSGNPGTGKTTVARLLASIYKSVGLLSKGQLIEVDRKDLVGQYIGETAIKTHSVCESAYGGVLFVDEAYELFNESGRDYGAEAIATLLTEMENHRKDFVVVFAGYSAEMSKLLDANTGLKSRITDMLYFPDYSEEELCNIAKMMAGENHYTITEEGMAAFRMAISKKMVDKKFGNGREVRNLVNSAMQRHGERYLKNNNLGMTTLSAEDFGIDLNVNIKGLVSNYLNELDEMVGLDSVKEEVRNAVNRASYILKETKAGTMGIDDYDMNMNLCFTGNPGTGKTTVARLYAKILYAIGFAKTGCFIEAAREDFVGCHQGETALKTRHICENAYGGVLFIDEAYSLVQSEKDEVGKEALATLIKEMENNRKKLVVIFAGYTAEMQEFMSRNSGLNSRISKFIEFEDYDSEELMTIFEGFARHGRITVSEEAYSVIGACIEDMIANKDRTFGNAREMRNLYEDIWANMVTRVEEQELTGEDRRTIRPEDVKHVR